MEELSVMMWRTNLADGVTINSEPGSKSIDSSAVLNHRNPRLNTPRPISYYGKDSERIRSLADLFLNCINGEHQFTQYETSEVFSVFPHHPPDLLFLHAAMLAAGATFENQPDSLDLSDEFAQLSESLVFTCFKHTPSIYIIQGLSILSWRSLALGHDHLGWTFLSMAAGMAVHLRLHVLALDEVAAPSGKPSLETVQTFWSFYMTDRTSISILGRNCILPWRRVNVPDIETFYHNGQVNLAQISFAWQCKLWYTHDQNMDQMCVVPQRLCFDTLLKCMTDFRLLSRGKVYQIKCECSYQPMKTFVDSSSPVMRNWRSPERYHPSLPFFSIWPTRWPF